MDKDRLQTILNTLTYEKTGLEEGLKDKGSLEDEYLSFFVKEGKVTEGVISLIQHYADTYFKDDPNRDIKLPFFEKYIAKLSNGFEVNNTTTSEGSLLERLFNREYPDSYLNMTFQNEWIGLDNINIHDKKRCIRIEDMLVLPEGSDIFVIGDSHGDSYAINMIVNQLIKFREKMKNSNSFLVFVGDYVSNGLNSIGEMELILQLKDEFPENVIFLNGNHDYRESWKTCFREYFYNHWDRYQENPQFKAPPQHYSHFRYDLCCKFGIETGEKIYRLFNDWGIRLPYIAIDKDKKLLISHSIGKSPHISSDLVLEDLVYGKVEDRKLSDCGEFLSKLKKASQHRAMVSNRNFSDELIAEYKSMGFKNFLIGHSHYKSKDSKSGIYTICSSCIYSPDSGHYMYQEMNINRAKILNKSETGPCYIFYGKQSSGPEVIPFTTS